MKWMALGILTLCMLACRNKEASPSSAREQTSIFLISIDTLRSDRLGAYGYAAARTPVLDQFRREAILFERAYSHVPQTLPSHATIFTGLLPPSTQVRDNLGYTLPSAMPTVAEKLAARGYVTGAAVSSYVLRKSTGIGRGFSMYDDAVEGSAAVAGTAAERSGDRTREALQSWIAANSSAPLFGFLHLFEPHAPYRPPAQYADQHPYDGEVSHADAIVGRFFAFLRERGLYDRSLIVVLSDHGEGLGDHGEDEHGVFLYRESVQVPLLIKLPQAARGGSSVAAPVGLVDVAPTLLRAVGIGEVQVEGIDLLNNIPADRGIYGEAYYPRLHLGWSELRSLIREHFHYIDAPARELYDLAVDPMEKNNVLSRERRTAAALDTRLRSIPPRFEAPRSIDPEEQRQLAALGYIGSTVGSGANLPDPKTNIHFLRLFAQGARAFESGRDAEALQVLERLTRESPSLVDGWALLARVHRRNGRNEQAHRALRSALQLFPQNPHVALAMADLLMSMGRREEAREHARLAVRGDPVNAHLALAQIAFAGGEMAAANEHALQALRDAPRNVELLRLMANLREKEGRPADQLEFLDRAAAALAARSAPPLRGLQHDRGMALLHLRRPAEAESALAAEVSTFPNNLRAWGDLAAVRAARGDAAGARRAVQEMLSVQTGSEARRIAREIEQLLQAAPSQGAAAR